jgi:asparagine synthase (glutamine-hydrolysing)
MGFGVPIRTWLRGPLMDWCEDLLDATRLKHEGILDVEEVRKKWTEHKSGERNWEYLLWSALMFEAWHREWMSDGSAPRTAAATAQTGNIELQTPIAAA